VSTRSQRLEQAARLWARGDAALAAGRTEDAFAAYTAAHDRVTDMPRPHQTAHEKLLPVDVALGRGRDARVDRILLALAPFGVFTALAWYFTAFESYARFTSDDA
jgi:hypothetical protein